MDMVWIIAGFLGTGTWRDAGTVNCEDAPTSGGTRDEFFHDKTNIAQAKQDTYRVSALAT